MKKFLLQYWKSVTSLTLIFAIIATSVHVELFRLAGDWLQLRDFWTAQTITQTSVERNAGQPSGPRCVDVENMDELFVQTAQDIKNTQERLRREEAYASEHRVPEELLQTREPIPEFSPRSLSSVTDSVTGAFASRVCAKAASDSDVARQARERDRFNQEDLRSLGAMSVEFVESENQLSYRAVLSERPPVTVNLFLCEDGKFRSADGILTYPTDEGLRVAGSRFSNYRQLQLQALLRDLPTQPYSRSDISTIFQSLNNSLGEGVFDLQVLDEIFSRNNGGDLVISGGKIYFVDVRNQHLTHNRPQLSVYNPSIQRFEEWSNNDFRTIENLPGELRTWAKNFNVDNVLSRSEVRAASYLEDLSNVMNAYQTGSTRNQREEWTLLQTTQKQNYTTIAEQRAARGQTSLSFTINPRQQEISIAGAVGGKLVVLTFHHVGDNIYEYTDEQGRVYRWLITGSITNLQQGSRLFDRIAAGQPPEDIVRMNPDGTEWTRPESGVLESHDFSYVEWKSKLKKQKEDEEIRVQALRDRLQTDFASQPRAVQLRIRQLDLFTNDLAAFRNETENAVASQFASFLRQSYAKYHPLGENGLGVFDFGGSESNFKERIMAMVNLFIDLYLTPKEEYGNKSRLQVLLEENPHLSLQELLMKVNEDGSGTFIQDPAMGDFIRNIFLNYTVAGFNITTHYNYDDPRTEQDLLDDQLAQLELLSGTFFDDYDPSEEEGGLEEFLSANPNVTVSKRLLESIAGKRDFVMFESRLFDFLETEVSTVIANQCNTGEIRAGLLAEAESMVRDSLDAHAVNNKGVDLGMSVRDWLRVGPDTRYGTDEMRQVVENMVEQRLNHLQRQCAVKHMLTLKDADGVVTGGISDPTKRKMFQLYVRVFDLTNDWFTLSKQSWNTIFDEVLINAPLMFVSAGAANLVLKAALTGISRLTRAMVAGARVLRTTRVLGSATRSVLRSVFAARRAYKAGSLVLDFTAGVGRVSRSVAEGALEGVFEQVLSLNTLEEIATGRTKRTGEDWAKAIASEAFAEGAFDFAGGLSSKIFRKAIEYRNIFGQKRFAEISSWFARLIEDRFPAGGLSRQFLEERLQELNSMGVLLAFNYITQTSPNQKYSDSVAQSLMGDQRFQENLLHVFLQVMSFSHGRKIASKLTESSPFLNSFFNGGHGSDGSDDPGRDLGRVNNDIAGIDSAIDALKNSSDFGENAEAQSRVADLLDARQGLLSQRAQLQISRLGDIVSALAEFDRVIAREGMAYAQSHGILDQRQDLMRERSDLQQSVVNGTLAGFEADLRSLSQQIQILEGLKAQAGEHAELIEKVDAQLGQLRGLLFSVSTAKNRFSTQRADQLRTQIDDLSKTIQTWRSLGADPAVLADLNAQEAALRTELRDLREQRTNVDTQAEYDEIVRAQTANGTFQATDAYGHVDLATGRWYANRAKLKADLEKFSAEIRANNAQAVVHQIGNMDAQQLGRMLALPDDPVARQRAIDDLKNQLQNNPEMVDAGRGEDGKGASLRDLLIRHQQRNLLENHVRHEMGHRFERALDPKTRTDLAKSLGLDLTNSQQRQQFEENVADWLSGNLPVDRMKAFDDFFRNQIKLQNPNFTAEQVENALRDMKKVSTIRETFNQSYQAGVGVDFQTGDISTIPVNPEIASLLDSLKAQEKLTPELEEVLRNGRKMSMAGASSALGADGKVTGMSDVYFSEATLLGEGAFGRVFKGFKISTNKGIVTVTEVAVKTYKRKAIDDPKKNKTIEYELLMSKHLMQLREQLSREGKSYPEGMVNVEGVFMVIDSQGKIQDAAVAQELITSPTGGAVELGEYQFANSVEAEQALIGLMKTFAQLHQLGMVLNDIKQQNLVVQKTADGRTIIKVIDPGLANLSGVPSGMKAPGNVPVRGESIQEFYYTVDGELRSRTRSTADLTYSKAPWGSRKTMPGTQTYYPARIESIKVEADSDGNKTIFINLGGVVLGDGEIPRIANRGYFLEGGFDPFSIGVTLHFMLQESSAVPNVQFVLDGKNIVPRSITSNLGDLLTGSFRETLMSLSENLMGIKRNPDGSVVVDRSSEGSLAGVRFVQNGADILSSVASTAELPNKGSIQPDATRVQNIATFLKSEQAKLVNLFTRGAVSEQRQLFTDTFTDPLTGLLNRGGLKFLDRMIATGKRVSILSYDGDHFKAYNEVLSREYGDYFIQVMGKHFHALVDGLRKSGYPNVQAVRMGGEEFMVFGEVPLEVLQNAMRQMAADLKAEIRGTLKPDELNALAEEVFTGKYQDEGEAGREKARREIGGSTAGVLEFDFADRAIPNPAEIRANALQYTDQWLEFGKNEGGRGQVYANEDVQNRRTDDTDRLFDFRAHNSLDTDQNSILEAERGRLNTKAAQEFSNRLTARRGLITRYGLNAAQVTALDSFLQSPLLTAASLEAFAKSVVARTSESTSGRNVDQVVEDLKALKEEYLKALRDFGNYTGAATIGHLNGLDANSYTNARKIEPGEFKSINETLGHTHGDTFLMYVYESVFLETARKQFGFIVNGPNADIVIAQKGASFSYRLRQDPSRTPAQMDALRASFEQALQVRYEQAVRSLFDSLGRNGENGKTFEQIRLDWLRENKQAALDQSFPDQNRLLIQDPFVRTESEQDEDFEAPSEGHTEAVELDSSSDAFGDVSHISAEIDIIDSSKTDQVRQIEEGLASGRLQSVSDLPQAQQQQAFSSFAQEAEVMNDAVRANGEPVAFFGSTSIYRKGIISDIPGDIDIATSPKGMVDLYQAWLKNPNIVIVAPPYLHAAGGTLEALRMEAYMIKDGVVISLEAFGEAGEFTKYRTAFDGGGVDVDANGNFQNYSYGEGLFGLGDPSRAKSSLTADGKELTVQALIDSYKKILELEKALLQGDITRSRFDNSAEEMTALQDKIKAREERIKLLENELDTLSGSIEVEVPSVPQVRIPLETRTNAERKPYAQVSRPTDVTAIPDVHGDPGALKRSLQHHNLVDANGNWIGGNRATVMLGDYIDRGKDNLGVLDYMVELKKQAELAGGHVKFVLGNHEALMLEAILTGNLESTWTANGGGAVVNNLIQRYGVRSDAEILAKLRSLILTPPDGTGDVGKYYDLFRSMEVAVQVDDMLYVHAGVSPKWAEVLASEGVEGVNRAWREALESAQRGDFTEFNVLAEVGTTRGGDAEFGGLFWNDYNTEALRLPIERIREIARNLKNIGINGIFVGHTVMKRDLSMADNFLQEGVFLMGLDVGMSDAYAGRRGAGTGVAGATILSDASGRQGQIDAAQNGKTFNFNPAESLPIGTEAPTVRFQAAEATNHPEAVDLVIAEAELKDDLEEVDIVIVDDLDNALEALGRNAFANLELKDDAADILEAQEASRVAETGFPLDSSDPVIDGFMDQVQPVLESSSNPQPETNPKNYVKAQNAAEYMDRVYDDLVARGELDSSRVTRESFRQENQNTIGRELAYVSQDGHIIFNMEGIRAHIAENPSRSFVSVYRELITHENVHRTFNQLPAEMRQAVMNEVQVYFERLRYFAHDLSPAQNRLMSELARNLDMSIEELLQSPFNPAVADEMIATYFGLVRAGEIEAIGSFGEALSRGGIDVNNFYELSHAREVYAGVQRYQQHEGVGRRTQQGVIPVEEVLNGRTKAYPATHGSTFIIKAGDTPLHIRVMQTVNGYYYQIIDPFKGPLGYVKPEGTVIGRSTGSDIVILDPKMSRSHVKLFHRNGELIVQDLGSNNGTKVTSFIDEPFLSPAEQIFGPEPIVFRNTTLRANVLAQTMITIGNTQYMVIPSLAVNGSISSLRVINFNNPRESFNFRPTDTIVFGRDPSRSNVVLTDPLASRTHVEMKLEGNVLSITDLNTVNGTKLEAEILPDTAQPEDVQAPVRESLIYTGPFNKTSEELANARAFLDSAILGGNLRGISADGSLVKAIPEWARLTGDQNYQHAAHDFRLDEHVITAYEKTLENEAYARLSPEQQKIASYAIALHDIAKRTGSIEEREGHKRDKEAYDYMVDPYHPEKGAVMVTEILARLGYDSDFIEQVALIVKNHDVISNLGIYGEGDAKLKGITFDSVARDLDSLELLEVLRALNEGDIKAIKVNESKFWNSRTIAVLNESYAKVRELIVQQQKRADSTVKQKWQQMAERYKEIRRKISAGESLKGSFSRMLWTTRYPVDVLKIVLDSGKIGGRKANRGINAVYGSGNMYGEIEIIWKDSFTELPGFDKSFNDSSNLGDRRGNIGAVSVNILQTTDVDEAGRNADFTAFAGTAHARNPYMWIGTEPGVTVPEGLDHAISIKHIEAVRVPEHITLRSDWPAMKQKLLDNNIEVIEMRDTGSDYLDYLGETVAYYFQGRDGGLGGRQDDSVLNSIQEALKSRTGRSFDYKLKPDEFNQAIKQYLLSIGIGRAQDSSRQMAERVLELHGQNNFAPERVVSDQPNFSGGWRPSVGMNAHLLEQKNYFAYLLEKDLGEVVKFAADAFNNKKDFVLFEEAVTNQDIPLTPLEQMKREASIALGQQVSIPADGSIVLDSELSGKQLEMKLPGGISLQITQLENGDFVIRNANYPESFVTITSSGHTLADGRSVEKPYNLRSNSSSLNITKDLEYLIEFKIIGGRLHITEKKGIRGFSIQRPGTRRVSFSEEMKSVVGSFEQLQALQQELVAYEGKPTVFDYLMGSILSNPVSNDESFAIQQLKAKQDYWAFEISSRFARTAEEKFQNAFSSFHLNEDLQKIISLL